MLKIWKHIFFLLLNDLDDNNIIKVEKNMQNIYARSSALYAASAFYSLISFRMRNAKSLNEHEELYKRGFIIILFRWASSCYATATPFHSLFFNPVVVEFRQPHWMLNLRFPSTWSTINFHTWDRNFLGQITLFRGLSLSLSLDKSAKNFNFYLRTSAYHFFFHPIYYLYIFHIYFLLFPFSSLYS